jgi:hypothetical protein
VTDDEFNLCKFIVDHDVMVESLDYLETCAKIMTEDEKIEAYKQIQRMKEDTGKCYVAMCKVFLEYKNAHAAQVIMRNLVQKGYHLSIDSLQFFFYL